MRFHSLPVAYLVERTRQPGPRWRLRSPYLEHCSQAFARFFMRVGLPGTIPPFPLGQHDIPDHFHVPQKLYGRQAEQAALLAAFDSVSCERASDMAAQHVKFVLIGGYSGIGKSSLVRELYKPITARRRCLRGFRRCGSSTGWPSRAAGWKCWRIKSPPPAF